MDGAWWRPTCLRGVEDAQAAVRAELDMLPPIHAAVIPFPSLASTAGPLSPLRIYGEVELGTQPKKKKKIHLPSVLGGGAG